jgi:hypothetical protein
MLPPGVPEFYIPAQSAQAEGTSLFYEPALLGMDIAVTLIALAWIPYWQNSIGISFLSYSEPLMQVRDVNFLPYFLFLQFSPQRE